MTSFTWSPGTAAALTLPTHAGHVYQLQRTTELAGGAGAWEDIGAPVEGTGAALEFTDAAPPDAPRCFYRIVVNP